jgi:hypothetical protein
MSDEQEPSLTTPRFSRREDGVLRIDVTTKLETVASMISMTGLALLLGGGCSVLSDGGSWWMPLIGSCAMVGGVLLSQLVEGEHLVDPHRREILRRTGPISRRVAQFDDVALVAVATHLRATSGPGSRWFQMTSLAVALRDGRVLWLSREDQVPADDPKLLADAQALADALGAPLAPVVAGKILRRSDGPVRGPEDLQYGGLDEAKNAVYMFAFGMIALFIFGMLLLGASGLLTRPA